MHAIILFNEPTLPADHPDWAQEAGVLESVDAIDVALTKAGHRTTRLGIRAPVEAIDALRQTSRPDVVFNLFEGFGGVGSGEAAVARLLDLLGWPYTGSPAACLEIARDKLQAKRLLAGAGLPTPQAVIVDRHALQEHEYANLLKSGPWIVKPAHEDGSLGIDQTSVVETPREFAERVEYVTSRWQLALAERYIDGRELNVGIVATLDPRVLPISEIEFDTEVFARRIVTYDAKWANESAECIGSTVRCPAVLEPGLRSEIERIALAAFDVLRCRDYARIDLRVSNDDEVFILEANANPDLGPDAGLARSLRTAGISYDAFVVELAENASLR